MWEVGDKISYMTFNGRRDVVISEVIDQDTFICDLPNGKQVLVHSDSIIF